MLLLLSPLGVSTQRGKVPFPPFFLIAAFSSSSALTVTLTKKKRNKVVTTPTAMESSSYSLSSGDDRNNQNHRRRHEEVVEYCHYEHKDGLDRLRWSARESFRYMYGSSRPWHRVSDFYAHLITAATAADDVDDGYASSSSNASPPPPSALLFTLLRQQKNRQQEEGGLHNDDEDDVYADGSGVVEEAAAAAAANHRLSSGGSGGGRRGGRWERQTFKILLSYHGPSFDGWQKQPALNTVQGLVEKVLGRFVDDRKAQQLRDKSLPLEGCAVVAGRTDKGVTALQQVCSFYTWNKGVKCEDIKVAINDAAPGKLRAVSVSKVSRVFHPNFKAKWRRYFYIFPLDDGGQDQSVGDVVTSVDEDDCRIRGQAESNDDEMCSVIHTGNEDASCEMKPRSFKVSKVNELLRQLEGRTLSYKIFARDTKASRSIGPPTECFMFHARAVEANLPYAYQASTELRVMCVELVANRFLRKMVRVLVATAIREAAAGASDDALLKLMDASCRRATAPPAPPDGLCLVDVGYGDFEQESCFIQ